MPASSMPTADTGGGKGVWSSGEVEGPWDCQRREGVCGACEVEEWREWWELLREWALEEAMRGEWVRREGEVGAGWR